MAHKLTHELVYEFKTCEDNPAHVQSQVVCPECRISAPCKMSANFAKSDEKLYAHRAIFRGYKQLNEIYD